MKSLDDTLGDLYEIISNRRTEDPKVSYTALKFSKGTDHIAKKIGEEATEVAIAAARRNSSEIISESSDLLFHLLVLWVDQGILPSQVFTELESRRGVSGLTEKESRRVNKKGIVKEGQ